MSKVLGYKIKCIKAGDDNKSVYYGDYVTKGVKGWKVCGKPVEKAHIFSSFNEADKVRFKLWRAYKGKAYFLVEVSIAGL